jgi:starch-binding outer membrane protein, SusD/RagB family
MGKKIVLAVGVVVLAGCGLDIPDLNDQGVEDLRDRATPARLGVAATGLLIGTRTDMADLIGYVVITGVLGREVYDFDAADPRPISELLEADTGKLPSGSPFSGSVWTFPYRNIRSANIILGAVDTVAGMTDAEKEATRGFAKTIAAIDYIRVISTRDELGAVVQKTTDLHALDPLATKVEVLTHISTLLDEAKAHLMAGGEKFPFPLSSGFKGFDTPATFLKVNRALQGRVQVYRKNYPPALAALSESFLSADAMAPQLDLGAYHVYGTGSGDKTNAMVSPNLFAHPSVKAGAEMTAAGQPDARVARKLRPVDSRTFKMLTSDQAFTLYDSPTSPVPIIRNEELILLRAEANIGLGNLAPAIEDLNFIRVQAGGLAPRTDITADNAVDELLKQRFYSLLFEGGHRWFDMRRLGRLEQLPVDRPEHHLQSAMPIPLEETDARMPPML